MRVGPLTVVAIAVVAGGLGVLASLFVGGPGPLLGTEAGQRLYADTLSASAPAPPEGVSVPRRGGIVAPFSINRLDGSPLELPSAYAGRRVLVNLWASWCGPCIEEMPELDRFAREQGDIGVQVLGVALDDADAVRAFLQRIPVAYAIALDAPGPADAGVRLGNPRGVLPYSVLLSEDGRLLKQRIGPFAPGEIDGWVAP
ncbi:MULTISPECIES: TlpA disulfide reductase family protein [Luteimonas]|uniref:Alkyl hydroperoxide reductase n=1 Tax=Luteimonas chenhongjianii TaxID=2006110 RepID=A0A290XCP7_9GAMM|nr:MULTISPECIES: TlpA disulfide reductase family protein [Luteimonas]ATD66869.1 alkyl hydroperoxide reductase [Luteimonas chenhongjianii]RPD84544.1 TlpA family protein disulfide reductase [Luteimonas sp. 100069]